VIDDTRFCLKGLLLKVSDQFIQFSARVYFDYEYSVVNSAKLPVNWLMTLRVTL
jgi:hypothetical protein